MVCEMLSNLFIFSLLLFFRLATVMNLLIYCPTCDHREWRVSFYQLFLFRFPGFSNHVLPHCFNSPSSHVSVHYQCPLCARDAVPSAAATRTSEGWTVPASRATGLRAICWWEGGTCEGTKCTTTSAFTERRPLQSLNNWSDWVVTIFVSWWW